MNPKNLKEFKKHSEKLERYKKKKNFPRLEVPGKDIYKLGKRNLLQLLRSPKMVC